MIPLRLRLAGFLSIREPQELDFRPARLWLLCGPNGSGKSAVFDAFTWCLFGLHRGGQQPSPHLIHADCSRADIELEFALGEQVFRAERSLRRTRSGTAGSQQLLRRAGQEWHPVPETTGRAGFENWVAAAISPTPEAFTTAMLLRQGQAEQLLNAPPRTRADILSCLLKLDRYRDLHQRARREMLGAQAAAEASTGQLQLAAEIGPQELEAARTASAAADDAVAKLESRQAELETLLAAAHRWHAVQQAIAAAAARQTATEHLLHSAAAIERDHAHWLDLAAAVPAAERVLIARTRRDDSHERTARFEKQQQTSAEARARIDRDLDAAKAWRAELEAAQHGYEQRRTEAARRLRELAAGMQIVRRLDELESERVRLHEAQREFPTDLDTRASAAQAEAERLKLLAQQLPLLDRLRTEQRELFDLRDREAALHDECDSLQAEGETARAKHDRLAKELRHAEQEQSRAEAHWFECDAAARLSRHALHDLERMRGAAACTLCGQPLTPEHFHIEQSRRAAEAETTEAALTAAAAEREIHHRRLSDARQAAAEAEASLQRLRGEYREQHRAAATATQQAARLEASVRQLIDAVNANFRNRPFDELREESARQQQAEKSAADLRRQAAALADLRGRVTACEQAIARMHERFSPNDADSIRRDFETAAADEHALGQQIQAARQAATEAEQQAEALARRSHELLAELTDLTARLRAEEDTRRDCTETIDRELRRLPPDWQLRVDGAGLGDLATWKESLRTLESGGIAARHAELAVARQTLEAIAAERAAIEKQAAAFPDAERRDPADIEAELVDVRSSLRAAESHALNSRAAANRLAEHAHARAAGAALAAEAERELRHWRRLEQLLGREGLQRELMRGAEQSIVAAANQRLAVWGEEPIQLSLADGGGADRALELLAQPAPLPMPLPPAFLSVGQRFRVGIALALALGDAAGQRPMQSLALDDPFASLDPPACRAFITALGELSRQLGCIIVSSHDPAHEPHFAAAYRFERRHGSTRITMRT